MKKSVKITLWVLGTFAVVIIGLFVSADIVVSRLVQKEVSKRFDSLPDADASIGGVYLNLLSGSAIVKDITFGTHSLTLEDETTDERAPGLAMHIPTLAVWNINYIELLKHRHLAIYKVSVDEPKVLLYLDEEHPESILPAFPKDTTLEKASIWLSRIDVQHIEIDGLCARMKSTRSPLYLSADTLTTEVHDIAYDFTDSVFTYNDSVYSLSLAAAKIAMPDGLTEMEVHELSHEDEGPIELGYTRIRNVVDHKHMAQLAHEPITWIDLEINHMETSPLNPVRKALAQDCSLEKISVDVKRMHVCRDERYAPKSPFGTPQEFLRHLPVLFRIKEVEALAHIIDVDMVTTEVNCGKLHCHDIHTWLTNVSNHPGAVWRNRAKAPFGKEGKIDATYDIHMDKASSFNLSLKGHDIALEDMNPFIRPLVGITCTCHVNDIEANYGGDKDKAEGTFCMQYKGLEVKVHKEDNIPYKIVTNHADFFTGAANSLIPKSNPTAVDIRPRKYRVEWKRDIWSPYPLYLFGPCIDGVKKTMLPGLYVHKQV